MFKVGKIITSAFCNIISQSAFNTIAAHRTSRHQRERNLLQGEDKSSEILPDWTASAYWNQPTDLIFIVMIFSHYTELFYTEIPVHYPWSSVKRDTGNRIIKT